jgi:processive 1,2-diacylglycerol beta-glucosyltransferase
VRVLVLCADIGEGHVTVARALAADLESRSDVAAVELRTDLEVLGPRLGRMLTRGFHTHIEEIGWTYELAYRVFFGSSVARRASELALAALGGAGLRRTISEFGADVVVAEYPVISAALGELRRLGRLHVPVCSSISDPAGLYYWAHPGVDLHLLSWAESRAEVDRIAGPGRAAAIKPLVDRRFFDAPDAGAARVELDLPADGPVVVVSGGGWGLGDLTGATRAALAHDPAVFVVALAGRSAETEARLRGAVGSHGERVRVLGFTEEMPSLLAAADALIHTTGGTTALEARLVGCPLINFGTGVAHVREHARALSDLGLAEYAPDLAALDGALRRALARGRGERLGMAALPDAAELVVGVARSQARSQARSGVARAPR